MTGLGAYSRAMLDMDPVRPSHAGRPGERSDRLSLGLAAAGLPGALRLHETGAGAVIEALAERRWNLDAAPSTYSPRDTWDVAITPKVVDGVATHRDQFNDVVYYDTQLASVRDDKIVANAHEGWQSAVPAQAEAGALFRGMRYEEYQKAGRLGRLVSSGAYNLGAAQVGLTYFSTDPEQAQSYASGFAPWQHGPTFDKPAIVVRVQDPGTSKSVPGTSASERGVPGGVAVHAITDVYVGRPYRIKPGRVELYKTWDPTNGKDVWTEGSRKSPTSWLVWKRVEPGALGIELGHLYRLGFCLTCGVSAQDCVQLGGPGSGNWGHAGRPGELGGSAPAEGGAETATGGGSPLATGTPTTAKKIGGEHINTVLLIGLNDGSQAVYKPEAGEAWNLSFTNSDINHAIDNRDFSLAEREAMAYEVDNLIGTELVPETVLRESFDVADIAPPDDDDEYGGGYDEDELREMYQEYKEKAFEGAAEQAAEKMGDLFNDARDEHLADINNRAEELAGVWNEIIDEHPEYEEGPYGRRSALVEHPTLPMGTEGGIPVQGFERGKVGGDVDPIAVLDEADVDVTAKLNDTERGRVREVLERELRGGAQNLLDVDEDAARDHLKYDTWLEEHQDTEGRFIEEAIQSFTAWREDQGYDIREDSPEIRVRNRQAPHPNGGSLQRFVGDLSEYGELDLERGDYHRFAVLDYVAGSMDRHGGNVFYHGEDKRPLGMDNGYSFPNNNDVTFRSSPVAELVRYGKREEKAGPARTTPPALREKWLANIKKTDWNAFAAKHKRMTDDERDAFLERVDEMTEALSAPEGLYNLWKSKSLMR
jgi:Phosphatidylinositol 3- and 4-kinase